MTDCSGQPETPAVRPRRRRWRYVVALLALVVLIGIGVYVYLTISPERELQAAIAETDHLDPRWRLEDIEADRAVVPEAENSGTVAIAAKQLLPKNWPFWDAPPPPSPQDPPDAGPKRQALQKSFSDLEPQRQLNDEQTTALRTEMTRAAGALAEARKLADLTEGHYPISYKPDWISTLLPHAQDPREIAALLSNDALLRAQDRDPDGALASCRGALNAGRSIGDEPVLISQLVRIACRGIATHQVERVLAQGEPSEHALRQCQELLEKEAPEPLLLIAGRGERAGLDRLMETIQSGKTKISARELVDLAGLGGQQRPVAGRRPDAVDARLLQISAGGHAALHEPVCRTGQPAARTAARPVPTAGSDDQGSAHPGSPAGPCVEQDF